MSFQIEDTAPSLHVNVFIHLDNDRPILGLAAIFPANLAKTGLITPAKVVDNQTKIFST